MPSISFTTLVSPSGLRSPVPSSTFAASQARLKQATEIFDFALTDADMSLITGLAWFASSPSNRVPPTVVDAYAAAAADAEAYKHVPRDRPPVAQPIKACDMAWNMLGGSPRKVEL